MTLVPRTPKTPRVSRTPLKSLKTPKSVLRTPKSLKVPRTLKTPKRSLLAARSARTPRGDAKPLTIGDMVFEAVEALNDRRGVSFHSIKKYLRDNKKVDTERKAFFIKKHLKAFVEEGKLVQVAGTGANGTFKLPGKSVAQKEKSLKDAKSVSKLTSRPKIGKTSSGQKFAKFATNQQKVPNKALKGKISKNR